MARQLIVLLVLLLGLGALHTAGTHRALAPKPAASKDPHAWLGTLPVRMDPAVLEKRRDRLFERMTKDAQAVDVRRFVCRSPAEVGALPMMGAVMRYVDALPASQDDKALTEELMQAAAHGNWLARTLLLPLLDKSGNAASSYRAIQLAEWLYHHRLGRLYADLEPTAKWIASYDGDGGNDPSGFLAAAAMQQDYAMQASVGRALIEMDDPKVVVAGGRMLACAAEARAAYEKMAQVRGGRSVRGLAERAGSDIGIIR